MSSKINEVTGSSQSTAGNSVAAKRSYVSPKLRRLGSVRELTLGVTSGPFEISMLGA